MAKDNIANHSMRLNLRLEQHLRVHEVLKNLNPGIHKSLNQFMVNAVDHYIGSFDSDSLKPAACLPKEAVAPHYVTGEEMAAAREEIGREVLDTLKEEMIRILGAALAGSYLPHAPAAGAGESRPEEGRAEAADNEGNGAMDSLIEKWG